MDNLNEHDCDILLEALDAWISKDFGDGLVSMMLSGLVSDRADPDTKARIALKEKNMEQKRRDAKKLRNEQAILLKVKVLRLRDSYAISQL